MKSIDPALRLLVADLGRHVELGELQLDENGACGLAVDGRFVVGLLCPADGEGDDLVLHANLGTPAAGPAAYATLLRGNLLWHATLGATLSLTHEEPPQVVMALPVPWRGLDAGGLAGRLEQFIDTADDWRELIDTPEDDVRAEAAAAHSSTPFLPPLA